MCQKQVKRDKQNKKFDVIYGTARRVSQVCLLTSSHFHSHPHMERKQFDFSNELLKNLFIKHARIKQSIINKTNITHFSNATIYPFTYSGPVN